MKRRAEEIGVQLSIRKGETGGTVVSLWFGS
jgi:signal transduction histidine kinase